MLTLRGARLQDRIVVFFVVLLMAVQLASFLFIRYAIEQTARNAIREDLRVGALVFHRLQTQNSRQLVEATSVLTYDAGFREAIAGRDREALAAAMRNHAARIGASGMSLIGLDRVVVADTIEPAKSGGPYPFAELMHRAALLGRTSAVRVIDGRAYQVVVVPVLAPQPIAWVSMDFAIDEPIARDLQRLSGSEVSFVRAAEGGPQLLATTLAPTRRQEFIAGAAAIIREGGEGMSISLGDEPWEALATRIDDGGDLRVFAVLQRSLSEGIEPYLMLQAALLFIAAASLAITLAGAVHISRRITRPLGQLAHAAREITRGNYEVRVRADTRDEVGELARAFDGMARGLAERDNIRGVLGKVASSEVVKQLLDGEIELGGQEIDATVLFTDVRNFTALCERLTPKQSLQLLNEFLTIISAVVEEHGGVVDKYMGDGVMAVFGAPVMRPDDPQRAVEACLAIRDRIDRLRPALAARGMPHPEVGMGLNTSRVMGGNIGSPSRLNYTVLGDGVNLASRLEGLTKRYHVPIVCGDRTRELVRGIVFRELDKVRVRGRSVAGRIFEPLGREGEVAPEVLARLARWEAALALFRSRHWEEATVAFDALEAEPGYGRLVYLYRGYIRDLVAHPPGDGWDAAFTLYEK